MKLKIIPMKFGHCYKKEMCLLFMFTSLILGTGLFMLTFVSIVKV